MDAGCIRVSALSKSRINIGKNDGKKQAGKVVWLFLTIFRQDSPVAEPCFRAQPPAAHSSGSSSRVRSCDSLPNHVFQRGYGFCCFRAHRVVSVDCRISNDAFLIDNESGWKREGPGIVSIVFFKINVELHIHFLEVFGQCERETVTLCHLVAGITQDFKG